MSKICPNCDEKFTADDRYCADCLLDLEIEMVWE